MLHSPFFVLKPSLTPPLCAKDFPQARTNQKTDYTLKNLYDDAYDLKIVKEAEKETGIIVWDEGNYNIPLYNPNFISW